MKGFIIGVIVTLLVVGGYMFMKENVDLPTGSTVPITKEEKIYIYNAKDDSVDCWVSDEYKKEVEYNSRENVYNENVLTENYLY